MNGGWAATRFDGRSAAGDVVLLRFDGDALVVLGRSSLERVPMAQLAVAESFEYAPRMIGLPGGRTLEVADPERTLPAAFAAAGVQPSWIVRLQQAWGAVVAALAILVGLGVLAYVEGVPFAARVIADVLPPAVERRMGENVLELLDRQVLKRSKLPASQRERIALRFREAAHVAAPGVEVRIEFRAGQVNAFALPGGIIVVFDDLLELAGDDERVLGVLGHELGHVVGRHSTRQLVQALGTGALAGLLWGDFSAMAANVPIVLGVMRYGRAFEDEADTFAIEFLRANNLSPRPLYEFLQRVRGLEGRRDRGGFPDFLSTHPDIAARAERLLRATEDYERGKLR